MWILAPSAGTAIFTSAIGRPPARGILVARARAWQQRVIVVRRVPAVQPPRGLVRADVEDVAAPVALLHPVPPLGPEQIAVHPHEELAQRAREAEEVDELLGKHVARPHVERRLT